MSALMKMVGKTLCVDPQLAFRVQLARSQLEVDLLPIFDHVMQLQKALKGELQVLAKAESDDPKARDNPRIKALKTEEETRKNLQRR